MEMTSDFNFESFCNGTLGFFNESYLKEPEKVRKKGRQLIDEDPDNLKMLLSKEIHEITSRTKGLQYKSLVVEDTSASLCAFICGKTECLECPLAMCFFCGLHSESNANEGISMETDNLEHSDNDVEMNGSANMDHQKSQVSDIGVPTAGAQNLNNSEAILSSQSGFTIETPQN